MQFKKGRKNEIFTLGTNSISVSIDWLADFNILNGLNFKQVQYSTTASQGLWDRANHVYKY